MANRSTIGLCDCCYATRTVAGGVVTISDGVQLPGAVQADISITRDSVQKYADNELIYEEQGFRSGTITLIEAAWDDQDYATLTGNTYSTGVIQSLKDPNPPEVAFGMIAPSIAESSGSWTKSYTAVFLPRVKFVEGDTSMTTRGESTSFNDPQIVGTIYSEITGIWREVQSFTTLAAAETWLFTKMDISV